MRTAIIIAAFIVANAIRVGYAEGNVERFVALVFVFVAWDMLSESRRK